jgi:hypothetical protein
MRASLVTTRPAATKRKYVAPEHVDQLQPVKGLSWSFLDWRHPNFHTVGPVLITLVLLLSFGFVRLITHNFYQLTPAAQTIVGPVNTELTKKLSYDAKAKMYAYNKTAEANGASNSPQAALAAAQNGQHIGGGANNYAVDLATDASKGVTIHDTTDTTGSFGISLIPEFKTREGKLVDGRVIYPIKGHDGKLVYSVKANGLKEDLVLDSEQGNTASFSYRLKLPASLEAHMLANGNIGIYSADPMLFGNISYGSDSDRARVEAARQKSAKNHLVFIIPAPAVVQSGKASSAIKAEFVLDGDQLTVKASGLEQASYPLSIDPSVVVTSANDFAAGNLEGGIEIDGTNNQIKRSSLTGGTTGAWHFTHGGVDDGTSFNSGFTTTRVAAASVIMNGYIYILGGVNTSSACINSAPYAQLTSDGTVGAWSTATLSSIRCYQGAFAYNGYIYLVGGVGSGAPNTTNLVEYAKANSDGSLGSWTPTSSLISARMGVVAAASNGYAYALGGCTTPISSVCGNELTDVQYAPIKADGSLGTWHYTHSSTDDGTSFVSGFTTGRHSGGGVVYNGYIYLVGGYSQAGPGNMTDIQYAPLNADGTVGAWITTTALSTGVSGAMVTAYNGYMYVAGGQTGGSNTSLATIQYAPLIASGGIGSWNTMSNGIVNSHAYTVGGAYKGYLYIAGGCGGTNCAATQTNYFNDIQFAQINPAGTIGGFTTSGNTFANASFGASSVAYNGYLYVIGGCTSTNSTCSAITNTVRYAAINADGSIGTFTTDGDLISARFGHASFAYNNRLYIVGGCSAAAVNATTCTTFNNNIQYSGVITNGNPAAWTTDSTNLFTTGRFWLSAVESNGYIYVAGGCKSNDCSASTDLLNDVWDAPINSGGDAGTFLQESNFDTNGRNKHASVVMNGYLYLLGGYGGATPGYLGDVKYALICNSNTSGTDGCTGTQGDIGTWHTDASSFTPRSQFGVVGDRGYIYVIGGCTSGTCSSYNSSIQFAQIGSNGALSGGWITNNASLAAAVVGSGVSSAAGYVYVAGGCTSGYCTAPSASVQYALINNGGSGQVSWAQTQLASSRTDHGSVAYNGYIYIIGGVDTNSGSACVHQAQYAPINPDGSLGAWQNGPTDASNCTYGSAFVYSGYLYTQTATHKLAYAPVCTAANIGTGGCTTVGSLGTWITGTQTMIGDKNDGRIVEYNGYVYQAGGNSGATYFNDVQYAQLLPGGGSTAWNFTGSDLNYGTSENVGDRFTTGRWLPGLIAYNGYLYILGGEGTSGSLGDVQYAKINPTGTIGRWKFTTSMPKVNKGLAAAATNGFLYVMGGFSGNLINETTFAAINSDGTLGAWQTGGLVSIDGYLKSATTYNGQIYTSGGTNGVINTNTQNHMDRAAPQSIGRKGTYSYLVDLSGDAVATKFLYHGVVGTDSLFGFNIKDATSSSATFGPATSYSLISDTLLNLTATEKRYRQLVFTLDDDQSAAFPDAGSSSTITDFNLYFHAATAKRLRNGKTFTTETQNSLDITPN